MAINHIYTIICDRVIRDSGTGNPTFVDVYSNIVLDSIPGGKNWLYVVIGLSGEDGEEFAVTLEGPGKYEEKPFEIARGNVVKNPKIDSQHNATVTFASVKIEGLSFDAEGRYQVVLSQGERVIHKTPLGVFVDEGWKERF